MSTLDYIVAYVFPVIILLILVFAAILFTIAE